MVIQKYGKPFVLSTTLVLGGLHLGNWVGSDASFRVQRIVVHGNHLLPEERIYAAVEQVKGKRILDVDLRPVQQRVEALPYVLRAEVVRIFPSTIQINVEERRPLALLNQDGLRPVDREGHVLPRLESSAQMDLPIVSGVRMARGATPARLPEPGQRLSEFIDNLAQEAPVLYHQISEFHLDPKNNLTLYLLSRGIPVYLGREGWLEKCDRLQVILPQISPRAGRIAAIDLRFENQVVTREPA